MSSARITEFYQNQQILITGGTGFVGKLLISKLLTSCEEIGKIILLIRRTKKENDVNQRLDNLFVDEIFDSLKLKYPTFSKKVEVIECDCEQNNLGLSSVDRLMLAERITIIFHCASNVEFDLNMATEVKINVIGALEIVKLAQQTKNLKVLVYVSSAFSNSHLRVVEEKYYAPSISYEALLTMGTDFMNENENWILGDSTSTYFFSKAQAESVLFNEGKHLPVAIFRPSAIISTWKEPLPGWTSKAFAPTALVKLLALGRISSIHCNDTAIVDMVPADLTINALIAVGWDVHRRYINHQLHEPRFYNYVSMVDNPLPFKDFLVRCFDMVQKKPPLRAMWYPTLSIQKSKFVNNIRSITRPWLLTAVVCLFASAKWKYRMVKSAVLYSVLMRLLANIVERPHIYTNKHIRDLWNDMHEYDRRTYFFDMKTFQWDNFLQIYCRGIYQYLLGEKDGDEEAIRRWIRVLRIIHYCTKVAACIFGFLLLRALFAFVSTVKIQV